MLIILYLKNFSYGKLRFLVFAMAGVAMLGYASYKLFEGVSLRIDDTIEGFSQDFFEGDNYKKVNLSTYSFLANYNVTRRAFVEDPVFGHGFGTHEVLYDLYTPDQMKSYAYYTMNRQDGTSMAFRLLTETGLVGLLIFLWFVVHFKLRSTHSETAVYQLYWLLNTAFFVFILLALFRNGNYTIHGKFLFSLCTIILTPRQDRISNRALKSLSNP